MAEGRRDGQICPGQLLRGWRVPITFSGPTCAGPGPRPPAEGGAEAEDSSVLTPSQELGLTETGFFSEWLTFCFHFLTDLANPHKTGTTRHTLAVAPAFPVTEGADLASP